MVKTGLDDDRDVRQPQARVLSFGGHQHATGLQRRWLWLRGVV